VAVGNRSRSRRMSQWPEPTPEADEPPRWPGRVALIMIVAAIVVLTAGPNGGGLGNWRMPEFSLAEFSLPEMPAQAPQASSPSVSEASEYAATFPGDPAASADANAPMVQSVPFESCLETIATTATSLGQPAAIIEDTAERRVARFKFLDSNLTVTCSRADGTMTIDGGN
jgi:hypothetical protein